MARCHLRHGQGRRIERISSIERRSTEGTRASAEPALATRRGLLWLYCLSEQSSPYRCRVSWTQDASADPPRWIGEPDQIVWHAMATPDQAVVALLADRQGEHALAVVLDPEGRVRWSRPLVEPYASIGLLRLAGAPRIWFTTHDRSMWIIPIGSDGAPASFAHSLDDVAATQACDGPPSESADLVPALGPRIDIIDD